MVFRQLRPVLTVGILLLSLGLGTAAGWFVAAGTSAAFVATSPPMRSTATPPPPSMRSTATPQTCVPARARDELLRQQLMTASPGASPQPVAEAPKIATPLPILEAEPTATVVPERLVVTPTAGQGPRCVVNVAEVKVRRAPGAADERTVVGGLPLGSEVRIRAGPQAVAGSPYTWVHIESASMRPATIQAGWVAYELLACAR